MIINIAYFDVNSTLPLMAGYPNKQNNLWKIKKHRLRRKFSTQLPALPHQPPTHALWTLWPFLPFFPVQFHHPRVFFVFVFVNGGGWFYLLMAD